MLKQYSTNVKKNRAFIEVIYEILKVLGQSHETMQSYLICLSNIQHVYRFLDPLLDCGAIRVRVDNEYKMTRKFYSLTSKGNRLLSALQELDKLLPVDTPVQYHNY